MEGDAPQAPSAQEVSQTPQQPPAGPQTPPKPTISIKLKKWLKTKKSVVYLIFLPVLIITAYIIFIAITYWNCNSPSRQACEIGKCSFSLSGFNLISEIKDDCCGNKICEVGEVYPECIDCPNCDDESECTKDSFNYDEQKCVYEQTIAPCYVRSITLSFATPEIDYQIKIELTPSNFDYSKAKTNGEDIRFFDENDNQLNYWIEDWNGEGVSAVWVKVASSETKKIYMYYGHPDASSASAGSNVFEFFEGFDYSSESELVKVWNKHGSPVIELSDSIVTITTSGSEEHRGQHIFKDVGSSILLNNLVEINAKRFPGHHSHMANIGYISYSGGSISDGDCWAALRYSPSPDGSLVVFGGNHGSITSSPINSFNIIKIYHQDGVSYAYEPPSTRVAEYSWPVAIPPGDYVLLGGATTISGSGKASYDWIRVRKYAPTEPSATVGNEETAGEGAIKEFY